MKSYNLKFKIIKLVIFILIFNFALLTFNLSEANAQQIDLAISPPLLETVIKPGKSVMIAFRLYNYGDPVVLSAKVLPFLPKDNSGHIRLQSEFSGPIRFSLDNANFEMEKPFMLKTNSSTQLLLRMRVPEGTPNGDYYYTLLAETAPSPITEGIGSARTKASIGSNILITVTDSGMVDVKGKVAIFDIIPRLKFYLFGRIIRLVDSTDKIPVVLIVQNLGKNLFKSQGQITLLGNFGEKAGFDIIPQNILSESQRLVTATPSAQTNCTAQACLSPTSLILSGFFIGRYNLNANINFGDNTPRLSASTSFIAVPIKFTFVLIVVAVVGILIGRRMREE